MKVLFVTSEVATLYKRGGLGDVSYALPVALAKKNVEVAILMPFFTHIRPDFVKCVGQIAVDYDHKRELVFVFTTKLGGTNIPVYLLRHPKMDEYENTKIVDTFAFFSKSASKLIKEVSYAINGPYDIIHCHDWHTALVPMLLGENDKVQHAIGKEKDTKKYHSKKTVEALHTKTIITIHNLLYQGETSIRITEKLGLPKSIFHPIATPLGTAVKLLREGLEFADVITTVSKTYAKEISSGSGTVATLIASRPDKVIGILNGIDQGLWNPRIDPHIPKHYGILDVISGKKFIKDRLQKAVHLPINPSMPLIGFVGRLEPRQKGVDLIRKTIQTMPPHFSQFIILGTGDPKVVTAFEILAKKYKDSVAFIHTFDERLARRIYAGSDIMLVPSKFEPCGLTQMIAMRYGTVPVVRSTGGLADSVRNGKTGFVFKNYTETALTATILHGLSIMKNSPDAWRAMIALIMRQNFSWDRSAREYKRLYAHMMQSKK